MVAAPASLAAAVVTAVSSCEDAQTSHPTRPQGRQNRRRSLMATLRIVSSRKEACFSIRLEVVLRHAIPECIAGDLKEPAGFGDIAACALQGFF